MLNSAPPPASGISSATLVSLHLGDVAGSTAILQGACAARRRHRFSITGVVLERLLRRLRHPRSGRSRGYPKAKRLLDVTLRSLETAIKVMRPGSDLGRYRRMRAGSCGSGDGLPVSCASWGHGNRDPIHESAGSNYWGAGKWEPSCARDGAGPRAMVNGGKPGVQVLSDAEHNRRWKFERSLRAPVAVTLKAL